MKTIKYKGEVVSYTSYYTNIYMIDCVDYNFKERKFNVVSHPEIYDNYNKAMKQIKKDAVKLANGNFCALLEHSADRYTSRYVDDNGVWKERTYKINCMSWNNRDLEQRL